MLAAATGQEAVGIARQALPDLVLLDLEVARGDGNALFRRLASEERILPIIAMADSGDEAVLSLDLGADDYVVKPLRLHEVRARVRASLHKARIGAQKHTLLHAGDIVLDEARHVVCVHETPVALTPIEFSLLDLFMRSPGRVFSRTELMDRLADSGFSGLDRTLSVHIHHLRAKVEPDPNEPQYIETVYGVGYRLNLLE